MDAPVDVSKLKYILYVLPTDLNCIRAMRLVPKMSRIVIQDIQVLPAKPQWLTGVPALARLEDEQIFMGSKALLELQRYVKFLDAHFIFDSSVDFGTKVSFVSPKVPFSMGPVNDPAFPLVASSAMNLAQPSSMAPSTPMAPLAMSMAQPVYSQPPPTPLAMNMAPLAPVAQPILPPQPPTLGVDGTPLDPSFNPLRSGNTAPSAPVPSGGSFLNPPPPPNIVIRNKEVLNTIQPLPAPQDPLSSPPPTFNPLRDTTGIQEPPVQPIVTPVQPLPAISMALPTVSSVAKTRPSRKSTVVPSPLPVPIISPVPVPQPEES
jgi:hypothetical protein